MKTLLICAFICCCLHIHTNAAELKDAIDCEVSKEWNDIKVLDIHNKSKKVPRFVSVKFNKVNARSDPDFQAPIEWVFNKKDEPVLILDEYEHWRKIQDITGYSGWMHKSSLSTKRFVVVIHETSMHKKADVASKIIAELCSQVRCSLLKEKEEWCKISCIGHSGWVQKQCLWGTYYPLH